MPLEPKYQKIKAEMVKKYGTKKGEQVFNAWANKNNVNPEAKAYFFVSEQFKAFNDDFVEGDFAVGLPDKYNDILTEDCLADMVEQLKTLPITIDNNHESFKDVEIGHRINTFNPIAKIEDPKQDGVRVHVKAVLNKAHQRYEEIKSSIKNGFLHSFSFGYIVEPGRESFKSIDGVRHRIIEKLRILNGCFTGVPVQPESQFTTVALKSMSDAEFDETEIKNLIGGIQMTDEKTAEQKEAELKAAETKAAEEKVAEKKAEEAKAAKQEAFTEEVKGFRKELAEVKSLLEKKSTGEGDGKEGEGDGKEGEGEDNKDEAETRLKALEAKSEEFGNILAKAQVKGLAGKDGEAAGAETKSTGPLDLIQ